VGGVVEGISGTFKIVTSRQFPVAGSWVQGFTFCYEACARSTTKPSSRPRNESRDPVEAVCKGIHEKRCVNGTGYRVAQDLHPKTTVH